MSGGANYGAMQASSLKVLIEAGLRPQMAVGTSAGALNSIYIAAYPTSEGMDQLIEGWRTVGEKEVGMPRILTSVRRLITGKSGLIPSEPLADFLNGQFPPGVPNFGELDQMNGIRAYNAAVCMETGEIRIFGDDPGDLLIDGAMSSTAVPPFYPPWKVGDFRYLDGGLVAKLPLMAAIERGATQIVALDIEDAMGSLNTAETMINIVGYSLSIMTEDQTRREIEAAQATGISVRLIKLKPPPDIDFWNYDEVERLIEMGRKQTEEALQEEPIRLAPQWQLRMRQTLARTARRFIP
jgi:predicted acylesterase/phospholipase RssA